MFLASKPALETVHQFISSQHALPFSYTQVGATSTECPAGFTIDHHRMKLGYGADAYQRSISALHGWKHLDLDWVTIVPRQTPVEAGNTVAVQARTFGFWSLSACRIVYVINESERLKKFGFAYGTLPDHVMCGEERFVVEWQPDDSVWYDILAFSRPQHILVKLGGPIARTLQKRFAGESLAAMVRAAR